MPDIVAAGFLFDMDGTLVDSTAVVEAVWGELCERTGIDFDELLVFAHGRQSTATVDHFLPEASARERAELVEWIRHEEEVRLEGVVEIPGARALMARLQAVGAPVALVTSAHRALAEARMGAAGIPMPAACITSESVDRSKPDPQGYLRGADLIGIPIQNCVAFEDAPAGIAAVIGSGAQLVVVGDLLAELPVMALRRADLQSARVSETADGTWKLSF